MVSRRVTFRLPVGPSGWGAPVAPVGDDAGLAFPEAVRRVTAESFRVLLPDVPTAVVRSLVVPKLCARCPASGAAQWMAQCTSDSEGIVLSGSMTGWASRAVLWLCLPAGQHPQGIR